MIGFSQYLEVDDVVDQGAVDKQLGGPQLEVDADVVGGQAVRAEVGPGDRLRTGGRWTGHTVVRGQAVRAEVGSGRRPLCHSRVPSLNLNLEYRPINNAIEQHNPINYTDYTETIEK